MVGITCIRCNLEKDRSSFYKSKNTKSGYSAHCKECDLKVKKETSKRWKLLNELQMEQQKSLGCVVCGVTDTEVLQFHHIEPLLGGGNQSKTTRREARYERVGTKKHKMSPAAFQTKVLDKCLVLCANDHLRVHAGTITILATKKEVQNGISNQSGIH